VCRLLDQLVKGKPEDALRKKTLFTCLTKIAKLGGYLARACDPLTGEMVMWRGMSHPTDIELCLVLDAKLVGN
jgi:hypothetical protein